MNVIEKVIDFVRQNSDVWLESPRKDFFREYPRDSLEGHLKEIAKTKFGGRDTKTAPHIVDLLVLAGIADLDYTKSSSSRKVQGVRVKMSNCR